jgi:hypothetical protein
MDCDKMPHGVKLLPTFLLLVDQPSDAFRLVHSLVLSLSKGERFGSWFDKLTTSG